MVPILIGARMREVALSFRVVIAGSDQCAWKSLRRPI
jgi:hypothetical protein